MSELEQLREVIKRLRKFHTKETTEPGGCSDWSCCGPDGIEVCSGCLEVYPCDTIKILDGEQE